MNAASPRPFDFAGASRREWLVTNGLGGFAMGTVAGVLTRRYHGTLIAALGAPTGRTLLAGRSEEVLLSAAGEIPLHVDRRPGGGIEGEGYRRILSFHLDRSIPVWEYETGGGILEKRIWMKEGANTTYVRYLLSAGSARVSLRVSPCVAFRDYHDLAGPIDREIGVAAAPGGLEISLRGDPYLRILSAAGEAKARPGRAGELFLAMEAYRGLDDTESLFRAGDFLFRLHPGEAVTVVFTAEEEEEIDGESALAERRERDDRLLRRAGGLIAGAGSLAPTVEQLVLAADRFMAKRSRPGGAPGRTIIAGYPWFTDWGRDTMIALPGIALCTGREETAIEILRTFADHVDRGMVPNRFPDDGEEAEYNTADASLWFFEATAVTVEATGRTDFLEEIFPVLAGIVEHHVRGTRHNIHVDLGDGLLYAGEPGVQLTWMDAMVDEWVVTPRIGKPVEINALWYNALRTMAGFAARLGEPFDYYEEAADRVAASFDRFWYAEGDYCYDVIDSPDGDDDPTLRPNQILAVSLPYSPLDEERRRAVTARCEIDLLTPHGLRSLAPGDENYKGRYGGDRRARDGAYHQGTVWGWLIGPFAAAHYRVHGDAALARAYLLPLLDTIDEHGVGNLSEIFDGDAPFTARGCPAQAWTVAEVLRLLHLTSPGAA